MAKGKAGKAVKITLIVLFALIVLICGGGYAYYFSITRSPLPQMDGELKAQGLKERVEIIRDSYGIPHIYAKNLIDLFFAQGYVQAQDRWWQMEFFRKTCGGRIEELTGKKAALVKSDIYLRSLGLYRVAEQEYNSYRPSQRAILDAFARGRQRLYLRPRPQTALGELRHPGLTGVKFKIEPWTPLDSLVFAKLLAWDLGLSARSGTGPQQTLRSAWRGDGGAMAGAGLAPRQKATILRTKISRKLSPQFESVQT